MGTTVADVGSLSGEEVEDEIASKVRGDGGRKQPRDDASEG